MTGDFRNVICTQIRNEIQHVIVRKLYRDLVMKYSHVITNLFFWELYDCYMLIITPTIIIIYGFKGSKIH